ncbi:MAG: glutamate racemase [Lachnospiraceae bacterium]|nr:glutamate racemase [Lachnospiraceae bacterium]
MTDRNLPIGVFDSGVGGLTVAREIFRNLPDEKIIYFGDTARVPYGNKSPETVIRYARQITSFLVSEQVKAIVIACNTASAFALHTVQAELDIPVIGVIEPGARAAVQATRTGRIGITGTTGTVSSGLYDRLIGELMPSAKVFSKACPLFVSLVEEGMIDDPVTIMMIHRYLDDMLRNDSIDTLVLGCTHYPLIRKVIAREVGSSVTLVNPAYETAVSLKELLNSLDLAADGGPVDFSAHRFFASDGAENFKKFARDNLNFDIENVELKTLQ